MPLLASQIRTLNGLGLIIVANYSALPAANTVPDKAYFVEDEEGTWWLPGKFGGTYYPAGTYYSNGVEWKYMGNPYQATQGTVDAGIVTDQFTTPYTVENSFQIRSLRSTRFISGTGVTVNADTTKFDIQVVGAIVDPVTFVPTPISVNLTAQTVTHIGTQVESYVWIDSTGTVVQSLTPPIPTDFDAIVGYWVLVHSNLTNITVINSFPMYSDGTAIQLHEVINFIGFKKYPGSNIVSPGTTGTKLTHTGGFAIKNGLGGRRPVAPLNGAVNPANLEMRHRNGVYSTGVSDIDVTNYNPSGSTVSALLPNTFQAFKVWKFASSLVRVQYGQHQYATINEALLKIDIDTYINEGNASRNGMHIGWIICKAGLASWVAGTEGVDYKFVDVIDGRSSGAFTPTIQATYDVSFPAAEFTTNSTQGAMTGKEGTGTNTNNVWEAKNNSGTVTWGVDGNGKVKPRVTSTTSSATPTPNADTDDEYILTALATNPTFAVPGGTPSQGQVIIIRIKDNGTARTLAFNAIYRFSSDNPAPTTTVLSKTMYIMAIYNAEDTKWDCMWRDNF